MENEITAHKALMIVELPIPEGAPIEAGAPIATIKSPDPPPRAVVDVRLVQPALRGACAGPRATAAS